jgi:hypothetical protein
MVFGEIFEQKKNEASGQFKIQHNANFVTYAGSEWLQLGWCEWWRISIKRSTRGVPRSLHDEDIKKDCLWGSNMDGNISGSIPRLVLWLAVTVIGFCFHGVSYKDVIKENTPLYDTRAHMQAFSLGKKLLWMLNERVIFVWYAHCSFKLLSFLL